MPVAYWRNKGDWGFLQWESVVNGSSTRMHPQSYGDYPKSLADSGPGMIGQTYSVRRGDGYVVLRRCNRSSQWTSFKDRFRLIKTSTTPSTRKNGDWSIMDLDYGRGEGLRLHFLPLVGQGSQTLLKNKYDGYDWEYSYGLAGDVFAGLWVIMPLHEVRAARGRQERRDSKPPLDRRRPAPCGHRPDILRSHESDGSCGSGGLGGWNARSLHCPLVRKALIEKNP